MNSKLLLAVTLLATLTYVCMGKSLLKSSSVSDVNESKMRKSEIENDASENNDTIEKRDHDSNEKDDDDDDDDDNDKEAKLKKSKVMSKESDLEEEDNNEDDKKKHKKMKWPQKNKNNSKHRVGNERREEKDDDSAVNVSEDSHVKHHHHHDEHPGLSLTEDQLHEHHHHHDEETITTTWNSSQVHEHHGKVPHLSQAEQHKKFHHHHESEDKNDDEDDMKKHEHHHSHYTGDHDVTKRGHTKKDKIKHSCKKDWEDREEEIMAKTKENIKRLMETFIEMFKSGIKMSAINGTANIVIVVTTSGGSVYVNDKTGNVTNGNTIHVSMPMTEEAKTAKTWETTRDTRSTSDSHDVSSSVSSEEMYRTTSTAINQPVTTTTLESTETVETTIVINPLVSVAGVTSTIEVENVTHFSVAEDTTTVMTILNSLN